MSDNILEISDLEVFYGAVQALNGVNIKIKKNEIVCLIGANGAGKTTLLMSIFGTPRANKGKIIFQEEEITQLESHKVIYKGISISPEYRRVFPKMSIYDNLLIGANTTQNQDLQDEFDKVYELFPILKQRTTQIAGTLSGGEQQMLAIARALMSKPTLLLLDEPSLGLAPLLTQKIFETLTKIAKQGTTIFLVEQNAYHALLLSNRGYVMVNGKIKIEGNSKDLLKNKEIKKAYLGG
jgi:branched-chain amino acid transport system ATP-binding protein